MRSLVTDPAAARALLEARPRDEPLWIVAGSLPVARALLRDAAQARGARAFAETFTLEGLAAQLARPAMEREGEVALTPLGLEVLVAELLAETEPAALGRYAAGRDRTGWVRALARALSELAEADVTPERLAPLDAPLAGLLAALRARLAERRLVDRAGLHARALEALPHAQRIPTLVLLAPRVRCAVEARLVGALAAAADDMLAVIPSWDRWTLAALGPDVVPAGEPSPSDALAADLFGAELAAHPGRIERFSARSASEECAELASRIARRIDEGAAPERIAIVLPDPAMYRAPLGEALARAGLAHASRAGARRPDPAGRAFLALLDCALEGLSARAFAEYLSFAVSASGEGRAPPAAWASGERLGDDDAADATDDDDGDDAPGRDGTPGPPQDWERLLRDASVVGGGSGLWRARLRGLRARLDRTHAVDAAARDAERRRMDAFEGFALPLVEDLEALPGRDGARASLALVLDRLSALATRALASPARVLAVLAGLGRRAEHAALRLDEVRGLLDRPLRDLPAARAPEERGVEVLGLDDLAGRSFEHVFVPGLAERIFPRPVHEDAILGDPIREALAARSSAGAVGLATRRDRIEEERGRLRAIVGAARGSVTASHARTDERGRARLPSLYLLELARAAEGCLPPLDEVAPIVARSALFAPLDPERAIDPIEHGLASLAALHAAPVPGRARYLFDVHPGVARAVRQRWLRGEPKDDTTADGLVAGKPEDPARALLARHRLSERAYPVSALEHFAVCPYRFFLSAILGLRAPERVEPLPGLDPPLHGALLRALQARTVDRLRREGAAWDLASQPRALAVLAEEHRALVAELEAEHVPSGALAPDLVRDARRWLVDLLASGWIPLAAGLAFGQPSAPVGAIPDEASQDAPLALPVGIRLTGSIDLVEVRGSRVRATDHDTGRAPSERGPRLAGGRMLRPLLHAHALEVFLAEGPLRERFRAMAGSATPEIAGGRLVHSTEQGGFVSIEVPHGTATARGLEALRAAVEDALSRGRLLRRPSPRACETCEFVRVCGPGEAARAARKTLPEPLVRLRAIP